MVKSSWTDCSKTLVLNGIAGLWIGFRTHGGHVSGPWAVLHDPEYVPFRQPAANDPEMHSGPSVA
jgi:hypothetical protein